jgi:hypothetical protein
MRIIERFRQTAPGMLVDAIAFDDSEAYVASWTETRTYRYRADLKLQELTAWTTTGMSTSAVLPRSSEFF